MGHSLLPHYYNYLLKVISYRVCYVMTSFPCKLLKALYLPKGPKEKLSIVYSKLIEKLVTRYQNISKFSKMNKKLKKI